jgi:CubicO group peptidase (beta-lactamase class C family)
MSEAPKSNALRPASLPDAKTQDNVPANVDSILQSILGLWAKSFGVAAVVLRGNCIVGQGVAGVRKKGAADTITLNDQFHLGSCAKAMTATLIAMLVEEGRLSWTATLGGIFAGTVKDLHPVWHKVTLPQLLAHRAGLRFGPDRSLQSRVISSQENLPHQRLEIARHTLSRPPDSPPRAKFSWLSYSNLGYVLAGAVLEHLTGRAWEDLMRDRLFLPLGITTGGFGAPGTTGKTDQPWGHSWITGKPVDPGSPDFPLFFAPAGLAHMTVIDWAKFVGIHLRGDPANPHRQSGTDLSRLIPLSGFAELHANDTAATYSAGWKITTARWAKGVRPGERGRCLWHAGSNGRWYCAVTMAPEIDLAVLVACNRGPDIPVWKSHQAGKALFRTFASSPSPLHK